PSAGARAASAVYPLQERQVSIRTDARPRGPRIDGAGAARRLCLRRGSLQHLPTAKTSARGRYTPRFARRFGHLEIVSAPADRAAEKLRCGQDVDVDSPAGVR